MVKITSFFKALSDQTRLRCLLLLAGQKELCVCELVEALDVPQPSISRHLAHLRNLGIVLDERRGQWVHYRVNPDLPEWAVDVLEIVRRPESEAKEMARALERIAGMMPRPRDRCG